METGKPQDIMVDCKYSPDRGITYYVERLAVLMRLAAKSRGSSVYAYTKEPRQALEAITLKLGDKAVDYIPLVARSAVPGELYHPKLVECYTSLLEGLLRRFYEDAKTLTPGMRVELMNIVLDALWSMARQGLPPAARDFESRLMDSIKRKGG